MTAKKKSATTTNKPTTDLRTSLWFFLDFPRPTKEADFQSQEYLDKVSDWVVENGDLLAEEP